MSQSDFIPRRDSEYDVFFRNIVDYVNANKGVWGHIPQADVQQFEADFSAWSNAYEKTLAPHIPQITTEKKRARKAGEHALRVFVNRFLRWAPVTDFDRDKIGVRNHDTIRTPKPAPATFPEIETDSSVIRLLSFRLRDHGSAARGKPENVHGMEFAWGLSAARPAHVGELVHLVTATANPIVLTFEEEQRGLRVYFAARWVNNTSQHGPWSDIESAFIP